MVNEGGSADLNLVSGISNKFISALAAILSSTMTVCCFRAIIIDKICYASAVKTNRKVSNRSKQGDSIVAVCAVRFLYFYRMLKGTAKL